MSASTPPPAAAAAAAAAAWHGMDGGCLHVGLHHGEPLPLSSLGVSWQIDRTGNIVGRDTSGVMNEKHSFNLHSVCDSTSRVVNKLLQY